MIIFKSGAVKSTDKRNIPLGMVQSPIPFPEVFIPDYGIDEYYQGNTPSCSGHAGAYMVSIFNKLEGVIEKVSPRFIYSIAKHIDNIDYSEGTTIEVIGKVLKSYGACREELHKNDVGLPLPEYRDYSKITEEAFDDGQEKITISYAFLNDLSFDGIKRAIYQNKAVGLLMRFDNNYFNGEQALSVEKNYGHFTVAYGYDKDSIYFYDSCLKGIYKRYFKVDFLPFVEGGIVMVDIPNWKIKILKLQLPLLRKVVDLYKQLLKK